MSKYDVMTLVIDYGNTQRNLGNAEAVFSERRQHNLDVEEAYELVKSAIEELASDAAKWQAYKATGETK